MRARPKEAADDEGERQPKALPKPLARSGKQNCDGNSYEDG